MNAVAHPKWTRLRAELVSDVKHGAPIEYIELNPDEALRWIAQEDQVDIVEVLVDTITGLDDKRNQGAGDAAVGADDGRDRRSSHRVSRLRPPDHLRPMQPACSGCRRGRPVMSIDFSKPVQTRDGRKVRILCTDGPRQCFPVVGFVDGDSFPHMWTSSGYWCQGNDRNCERDLMNVPPKKVKVEVRLVEQCKRPVAVAYADTEPSGFEEDQRKVLAVGFIELEYQP